MWTKTAREISNDQDGGQESTSESEDATVKTAEAISLQVLQHELTGEEKKWGGPAVHYSFGTLLGTAYGILAEVVPAASAGYGTAYGSIAWLAADEIAVPALGLSQSPLETPASSHLQALVSHLIYGLTTDLVRRALVKL